MTTLAAVLRTDSRGQGQKQGDLFKGHGGNLEDNGCLDKDSKGRGNIRFWIYLKITLTETADKFYVGMKENS